MTVIGGFLPLPIRFDLIWSTSSPAPRPSPVLPSPGSSASHQAPSPLYTNVTWPQETPGLSLLNLKLHMELFTLHLFTNSFIQQTAGGGYVLKGKTSA